mmetsp:Transcript_9277/g.20783  ORF Transcript_9277/g.20783 Transcript_9277/m.20783 type:complete len:89 (-) Transcript_9277:149-415(-)|eukprot:CAMPEP_0178395920 /NCGR_PEP_ID=MMETSP0689_2-20121128/13465_1 /TAXON_ID=160604 /ORGANISM="Amphidinium massartii, Strain CS-259" /LENGTH=88 /DNA_ID=CAMNT_0020016585 /DNA_START=28 /DNA_END=294 /DNA_ORIENTATION=+
MRVHVKMLTGPTISVEVEDWQPVTDLRRKIIAQVAYPEEWPWSLRKANKKDPEVAGEEKLITSKTVAQNRLEDGMKLYMVMELPEGGK